MYSPCTTNHFWQALSNLGLFEVDQQCACPATLPSVLAVRVVTSQGCRSSELWLGTRFWWKLCLENTTVRGFELLSYHRWLLIWLLGSDLQVITLTNQMRKPVRGAFPAHASIKNWLMTSEHTSNNGCTRDVWRAREKRKNGLRRSQKQLLRGLFRQ